MKKFLLILATMLICFDSCVKLNTPDTQLNVPADTQFTTISFDYSFEDIQPGNPILLDAPEEILSQITSEHYKIIDDTYYAPFRSGLLSGDYLTSSSYYTIYLTETTTGEQYRFEDYFNTSNMFLIKPGTYKVNKSYNPTYTNGINAGSICKFVVDEEIIIKKGDVKATLKPKHQQSLLICENYFTINSGGYGSNYKTYDSIKYCNLYYCFIDILNDLNYNDRYIIYGDENFEHTSAISLDDYNFEKGKYYIIPTIKTETTYIPNNI